MKVKYKFLILLTITISSCQKNNCISDPTECGKYYKKVKEIIQQNCTISCHAPSLGFPQGMPIILEADSNIVNSSMAIKNAVVGPFSMRNKRMPPDYILDNMDVEFIKKWVEKGGRITD